MLHLRCAGCGAVNRVPVSKLDAARCGRCHTPVRDGAVPHHLDDDALQSLIASSPVPVLVDFWAAWCGPCRMVAPHLETLAHTNAGKLIVVKIDTDKHQRTASAMHVQSIPTLAVWRGGQVVARQAGAMDLRALERFVGPFLEETRQE